MFSHVMVGANDLAASKKFYDAVLGVIGLPVGQADPKGRIFYRSKTGVFGITEPIDGRRRRTPMAAPSALRATAPSGSTARLSPEARNGFRRPAYRHTDSGKSRDPRTSVGNRGGRTASVMSLQGVFCCARRTRHCPLGSCPAAIVDCLDRRL